MKKKVIASVLSALMILSMMPTMAFAEVKSTDVCKIGDTGYETLAEAVAAVPTDGTQTTIVMLSDETITTTGIATGVNQNIVLDLNGKTIDGVSGAKGTSAVIHNNGTLVIKDSTDKDKDGENCGKITSKVTKPDESKTPGYASNTINNQGKLTIESGCVENATESGAACYAVDNNSTVRDVELNITGGKLYREKSQAVRMFCNSATYENILNMSGGYMYGGYSGFWLQLTGGSSAQRGTVNISGGKIEGESYGFYDYSYGNPYTNVSYTITGGEIKGTDCAVFSYGASFKISGGEFDGDVVFAQKTATSSLSVTGGKFNGDCYNYGTYECAGFISGGVFENLTYVYQGETYDCGWLDCIAKGYSQIDNNDSITKADYPYTVGHKVTFNSADGSSVESQGVVHGGYATKPTNPTKDNNTFAGWFKADGTQFLFNEPITENITLTAHWLPKQTSGEVIVEKKETATIESTAKINKSAIPLTDDEITNLQDTKNEYDVKVTLDVEKTVKPISSTPEVDAEEIQKMIKEENLKYGTYLDITVVKATYKDGEKVSGSETEIHETLEPITITVTVPENLREVGRTYTIIRCHDGETEILYSGKANSNWEITFETDKFSTYAIAYTDSVINTGDSNQIMLYASVALLALLGIGVMLLKKKAVR